METPNIYLSPEGDDKANKLATKLEVLLSSGVEPNTEMIEKGIKDINTLKELDETRAKEIAKMMVEKYFLSEMVLKGIAELFPKMKISSFGLSHEPSKKMEERTVANWKKAVKKESRKNN